MDGLGGQEIGLSKRFKKNYIFFESIYLSVYPFDLCLRVESDYAQLAQL